MTEIKYVRVCNGLNDKGVLVPHNDLYSTITNSDSDWYRSIYYYSPDQYKAFKDKGTISGIRDVETNLIVFDFDNKEDPEVSRQDALELASRLIKHDLKHTDFNIYYSGNKGFSVELESTSSFTPSELKNIATNLSKGLKTFDSVVYNPSRIFRMGMTKHNVSGLYKIPISLKDLSDLTMDLIKEEAKDLSNVGDWNVNEVVLPDSIIKLKNITDTAPIESTFDTSEFTVNHKMKWLNPCKQAILNGFFKGGARSNALMALAASIKAQEIPKQVAFHMLKGACELQAERYKCEPFSEDEIQNNIINTVYSPTWQGATYSCKDHKFLQEVCPVKNTTMCCMNKQTAVVSIDAVASKFSSYAADIDKNTIKTGIKSIDDNIRLQTCSHSVIAAASGTGKTSMVLNILNNVSNVGSGALFCSLDMNSNLIFQKLAQRVSGLDDKKLYSLYRDKKKKEIMEIESAISKEFKNVSFDFRSGITVEELRENILNVKQKQGDNLKLVVIDFINRIRGPYSEDTANLNYIAPRLSDMANETETLIISLAQTARHKGGPSTPLLDSRISKGSSAIEESATTVFGLWRDFYMGGENDKYMSIGVVKTRMGKEFISHLKFDGLTSHIRDMNNDEYIQYENLLERLENEKKEKKENKFGGSSDSPW